MPARAPASAGSARRRRGHAARRPVDSPPPIDAASIASTLSSRRWCRGSPLNRRAEERERALRSPARCRSPARPASARSCRRAPRPGARCTCRGRPRSGCRASCWPRPTRPRPSRRSGSRAPRGPPGSRARAAGRSPGSRPAGSEPSPPRSISSCSPADSAARRWTQLVLERGTRVVGGEHDAHRRASVVPGVAGRRPADAGVAGLERRVLAVRPTPSVLIRPWSPSRTTRRATSATRSTVNPNSLKIVPAGALAPKWSSPMIAPSVARRSAPSPSRRPTSTRDPLPDRRRQDRVAVRLVLRLEPLPARAG